MSFTGAQVVQLDASCWALKYETAGAFGTTYLAVSHHDTALAAADCLIDLRCRGKVRWYLADSKTPEGVASLSELAAGRAPVLEADMRALAMSVSSSSSASPATRSRLLKTIMGKAPLRASEVAAGPPP